MNGIYVVETSYDYTTQVAAFPTFDEAKKCAQKLREKFCDEYWVTFYNFGDIFEGC